MDTDKMVESINKELDMLRNFMDVGEGTIMVSETEDIDWINNWKQYFHQFYIDDLLVIPSWEEVKPEDTDKKIILYAPTWRDNQHDSSIGYTYKTEVDFDYLRDAVGDEYIILFRAHYLVASKFDFKKYKGFVYDVSKYDEINDLYLASDAFI